MTYLDPKSWFKVILFTETLVWGCWFSRPLLSKMILLQFNFFFSIEQTFQFLVNFWKKLILKIPPVFSLLLWSSRLLNSAILEVLLINVARILVWVCFYVTYYYSFWETSWCLLSPLEWTSDKKLVAKIRHCAISKSE